MTQTPATPNNYVRIFDTTLRDGEQAPGNSMNPSEKVRVALRLAELKVDILEAGYPASSPGDFASVHEIAQKVQGPIICALARTAEYDITKAAEALEPAGKQARIHTFISTSPIHMEHLLKMEPEEVLVRAAQAVKLARSLVQDVEFSAQDATRSDWKFLKKIFQIAINEGATTLNIPDTVGYTVPHEYAALIEYLSSELNGLQGVTLSVHCHNDLGLAVANSLAAAQKGARQIECTINGIGERAGNTSLEEVVMALKVRKNALGLESGVDSTKIYPTSRFLSQITGILVQPNKAIVGDNAFAHEAGIHQAGVLNNSETYEIMRPEDVGLHSNKLVLGKHSGRHALRDRLALLGYTLSGGELDRAFARFKVLADQKKDIFDEDLLVIVADEAGRATSRIELISVNAASGTEMRPFATVKLRIDDQIVAGSSQGDGPVDAAFRAVAQMTQTTTHLTRYIVNAITGGTDAQGEVTVRIEDGDYVANGQGADPDIMVASVKAYVSALNRFDLRRAALEKRSTAGGV